MTRLCLIILTICVSFFMFSSIQAQNYSNAVGARISSPLSVSYKTFINDKGHAIEGIVGFRPNLNHFWINVGAAYQVHNKITNIENLYWYFGGGTSAVIRTGAALKFRLHGYLGLDYKLPNTPVNLSVDWTPIYFLDVYLEGENEFGNKFDAGYGALSVRYVLN